MNKISFIIILFVSQFTFAQNTFPPTGPVGIGTLSPDSSMKLDVAGKMMIRSSLYVNDIRGGDGGDIIIGPNTGGPSSTRFMIGGVDASEVMRINYDKNIGIGTISPEANLHIKFSGTPTAFLRLESANTGQNASVQYVSGGIWRWETGTGITATTAFELYNRVTNKSCFTVLEGGNFGIGTTNPTSKLTVAGDINSREVKVTVNAGADFVFEKDYDLPSLDTVAAYIKENKHLPEIASAKEMQANGMNLSEMNIKLLQKIEELTLYSIEQEKNLKHKTDEIDNLKKENLLFNERLLKLEAK